MNIKFLHWCTPDFNFWCTPDFDVHQRILYIFCSSASGHALRTWFVVCFRLHDLQKSELNFFHLLRLAAVGIAFQTKSCFSSAAIARQFPCTNRLFLTISHYFQQTCVSLLHSLLWLAFLTLKVGIRPSGVIFDIIVRNMASASEIVLFFLVYSGSLNKVALITLFSIHFCSEQAEPKVFSLIRFND